MNWRPQILAAMLIVGIIAGLIIALASAYIDKVVPAAVTGICMLGMKLLEKE